MDALDPDGDSVFRRDFADGFVLVNPTSPWDGTGVTRTVPLGGTFWLAEFAGGGAVPWSGVTDAQVTWRAVTQVVLGPYSAAVMRPSPPGP